MPQVLTHRHVHACWGAARQGISRTQVYHYATVGEGNAATAAAGRKGTTGSNNWGLWGGGGWGGGGWN